jgi:hypothetical protein
MDIVAIVKNNKLILQLTERTEDLQFGVTRSIPGFPEDILWETPDHRFRHRPTRNATAHPFTIRGRTHCVISEEVPLPVLEAILEDGEVVNRLFQKGFVVKRYGDQR